jgi:hypothetical protein
MEKLGDLYGKLDGTAATILTLVDVLSSVKNTKLHISVMLYLSLDEKAILWSVQLALDVGGAVRPVNFYLGVWQLPSHQRPHLGRGQIEKSSQSSRMHTQWLQRAATCFYHNYFLI